MAGNMNTLKDIEERLTKVMYVEPPGPRLDGAKVLLEDARWLAAQLRAAYDEIARLQPKEVA